MCDLQLDLVESFRSRPHSLSPCSVSSSSSSIITDNPRNLTTMIPPQTR